MMGLSPLLVTPLVFVTTATAIAVWHVRQRKRKPTRNQKLIVRPSNLKRIENIETLRKVLQDGVAAKSVVLSVEEIRVVNEGPNLGHVPPLLCTLHSLRVLDLSGCSLTFIPWSFTGLKSLTDLAVARNMLPDINEVSELPLLTRLDASSNRIAALPPNFGQLGQLQTCNLMGNQLQELPHSFGDLASLRLLGLKSNRLNRLPDSFTRLTSLVELFITDNQLTELPAGFGGLASLVKLQASFNQLRRLPPDMLGLPRLELMRIAVCNVKALPEGLHDLSGARGQQGPAAAIPATPASAPTTGHWPRLAWLSLGGNPACAPLLAPRPGLRSISLQDLQLHDKLGDGASGEVLRATYQGQQVAVKFFRADVSPDGRTEEEVAISCAVDHPHLTRVTAIVNVESPTAGATSNGAAASSSSEAGGQRGALIMDLSRGKPMANKPTSQHLLRCKWAPGTSFTWEQVVRVAHGVASALEYLHAHNICHGDVYAHNILVDAQWHATLCDFGASFTYHEGEAFWEAMEVRAYGLFLKDLVDRCSSQAGKVRQQAAAAAATALRGLVTACADTAPALRPPFKEVVQQLAALLP